jgi:hypothetical protein
VPQGLDDDDVIESRVALSWTKQQMIDIVNANKPWYSAPFYADFQTVHKGDGAEYRLYFRALANQ